MAENVSAMRYDVKQLTGRGVVPPSRFTSRHIGRSTCLMDATFPDLGVVAKARARAMTHNRAFSEGYRAMFCQRTGGGHFVVQRRVYDVAVASYLSLYYRK